MANGEEAFFSDAAAQIYNLPFIAAPRCPLIQVE